MPQLLSAYLLISDKAAATSLDCLWSDGDRLDNLALQDELL